MDYGYDPSKYLSDFSWLRDIGNSVSKFAYQVPELIDLNKQIKENNKAKDLIFSSVNRYIDKLDPKVISNIVSSMNLTNGEVYDDRKARELLKTKIPKFSEKTKNEDYTQQVVDYFTPIVRGAMSDAGGGKLEYADLMKGVDNESIAEGVNKSTFGKQQLEQQTYDKELARKEQEYNKETQMMYGQGGRNEQAVTQQQKLTDDHDRVQNTKVSTASEWAITGTISNLGEPLSLSNINKAYTKAISEAKNQATTREVDPARVIAEVDNYFDRQRKLLTDASMEKDRLADNQRMREAVQKTKAEDTFKQNNPPVTETQLSKVNQPQLEDLNRAKVQRDKINAALNNPKTNGGLKTSLEKQLRDVEGKIEYLETYASQTQKTLSEFGSVEGPYKGTRTAAAPIQKRQQMEADIDRNIKMLSDYKQSMIEFNKKGKDKILKEFNKMVEDGVAGEPGQNRPFILYNDKIALNPKYNAYIDFLKTGKRPTINQVYSPEEISKTQEPETTQKPPMSVDKVKLDQVKKYLMDPNLTLEQIDKLKAIQADLESKI